MSELAFALIKDEGLMIKVVSEFYFPLIINIQLRGIVLYVMLEKYQSKHY